MTGNSKSVGHIMPEFLKKNTNFPIILEIVKECFTEKIQQQEQQQFQ